MSPPKRCEGRLSAVGVYHRGSIAARAALRRRSRRIVVEASRASIPELLGAVEPIEIIEIVELPAAAIEVEERARVVAVALRVGHAIVRSPDAGAEPAI